MFLKPLEILHSFKTNDINYGGSRKQKSFESFVLIRAILISYIEGRGY